jgi:hypothetical protein
MPSETSIRIRIGLPENESQYIRHARAQTLHAIGIDAHPELTAPIPHAVYVFADDLVEDRCVGMAEAFFLSQHYASLEEAPYASIESLRTLCEFSELAGIRTVYVEPEFRMRRALYMKFILSQAYIFRRLGARYSTATTNSTNARLSRLYNKTGGTLLGTVNARQYSDDPVAVYVFDLDRLVAHPGLPRTLADADLNFESIQLVRQRSAHPGH